MKYKLVIFDFDGTLADTFTWFLTVADDLADQFGLKRVDRSEIESLRHLEIRKIMQKIGVELWMLPRLAHHVQTLLTKDIQRVSLFEGIDQIIQQFANQGAQLAVVSSNTYHNISQVLGPENMARIQYFECGVSLYGKTRRLNKVLQQSGFLSHEAVSIGDEIRDIQAAKRAKIAFGAVAWGYTSIETLTRYSPEWVFNRVDDLMNVMA